MWAEDTDFCSDASKMPSNPTLKAQSALRTEETHKTCQVTIKQEINRAKNKNPYIVLQRVL